MTEAEIPSLTPPGESKSTRKRKAAVAKDPNAPATPRAPRTNYGFHNAATISLVEGKEIKYREGNRLAWYGKLKEFDGKSVSEFMEAHKNEKDPPRGWLRFFVQDGAATLTGQPVEAKAA